MYGHHAFKGVLAFALFVLLSPGLLLTIPAGSKGFFMTLQTSIPSILIHAIIFVFLYRCLSHCYHMHVRKNNEKRWHRAVREMEQEILNDQIAQMFVGQKEQRDILKNLAEKCSHSK